MNPSQVSLSDILKELVSSDDGGEDCAANDDEEEEGQGNHINDKSCSCGIGERDRYDVSAKFEKNEEKNDGIL